MNISAGLALKIAGSIFTTASATMGTCWLVAFRDGLTFWDLRLMREIEGMEKNTPISREDKIVTYGEKLKITASTDSSGTTHTFSFEPLGSSENIREKFGMGLWECKINGQNLGDAINKIKEKIGVEGSVTTLSEEHKSSMINLMISCSNHGTPWWPYELTPGEEGGMDKLSRTINVKNEEEIRVIFEKINIIK